MSRARYQRNEEILELEARVLEGGQSADLLDPATLAPVVLAAPLAADLSPGYAVLLPDAPPTLSKSKPRKQS